MGGTEVWEHCILTLLLWIIIAKRARTTFLSPAPNTGCFFSQPAFFPSSPRLSIQHHRSHRWGERSNSAWVPPKPRARKRQRRASKTDSRRWLQIHYPWKDCDDKTFLLSLPLFISQMLSLTCTRAIKTLSRLQISWSFRPSLGLPLCTSINGIKKKQKKNFEGRMAEKGGRKAFRHKR